MKLRDPGLSVTARKLWDGDKDFLRLTLLMLCRNYAGLLMFAIGVAYSALWQKNNSGFEVILVQEKWEKRNHEAC